MSGPVTSQTLGWSIVLTLWTINLLLLIGLVKTGRSMGDLRNYFCVRRARKRLKWSAFHGDAETMSRWELERAITDPSLSPTAIIYRFNPFARGLRVVTVEPAKGEDVVYIAQYGDVRLAHADPRVLAERLELVIEDVESQQSLRSYFSAWLRGDNPWRTRKVLRIILSSTVDVEPTFSEYFYRNCKRGYCDIDHTRDQLEGDIRTEIKKSLEPGDELNDSWLREQLAYKYRYPVDLADAVLNQLKATGEVRVRDGEVKYIGRE